MPTTSNMPQPRLTRVCAEAVTDQDHAGCSGGFCQCDCHPVPPPTPIRRGRPGRFGTAPPEVVQELARLRDARRAKRRGGAQ
jgi:hypothetical protein